MTNVAKSSFMKKIDCIMSEKSIRARSKSENTKIYMSINKRILFHKKMLIFIQETLAITSETQFSFYIKVNTLSIS